MQDADLSAPGTWETERKRFSENVPSPIAESARFRNCPAGMYPRPTSGNVCAGGKHPLAFLRKVWYPMGNTLKKGGLP